MQSGEPAGHCLNPEIDTATADHACHRPILEALIPRMFFKDPARGYCRAFVVGPLPLPLTHRTPHAAPFVMDFIALRSIVHNLLLRGCLSLLTHLGSHPRRLCCYKAAALSQLPHPRNLPAAIKQQQLLAKHFTSVPLSFLYGGKTTSAIYASAAGAHRHGKVMKTVMLLFPVRRRRRQRTTTTRHKRKKTTTL